MRTDYFTLYQAWRNFRRGKKPTRAIDEFAYRLEGNLEQLVSEIQGTTYRHGDYQKVVIREKKQRDLAVPTVRDRVVHRLLYDYLVMAYDKSFDPDVWSCSKGKGLHKCLTRTRRLLQKHQNSFDWLFVLNIQGY